MCAGNGELHQRPGEEQAAIRAENEQLRANLLRAISHDLRTPLTAISGNASNLLTNDAVLDAAARRQIVRISGRTPSG